MSDQNNDEPTRSTRDREDLRRRIEAWVASKVAPATSVSVGEVAAPSGSGMSSETLLFDASWVLDGETVSSSLVARIEPAADDVPIFPRYDLAQQFEVIDYAGRHSDVPVPNVRWLELDSSVIGAPFFVMDRVAGRVPADIPPYVIEGWLLDASDDEQRALQDTSVGVLAALHSIDADGHDLGFLELETPGDTSLRRHFAHQRGYYEWTREDRHHAVIEDAFDWLEANWPHESPDVLCWGDSRIGNIMYDDFAPAAVLDWEMAAVSPRELDVGWMIFLHRFFQDIALMLDLEGLPGFMLADDVAATYESVSGRALVDLEWFEAYAALRHAIVMTRVTARAVHFGEAMWPEDIDDVIPHRDALRAMISVRG